MCCCLSVSHVCTCCCGNYQGSLRYSFMCFLLSCFLALFRIFSSRPSPFRFRFVSICFILSFFLWYGVSSVSLSCLRDIYTWYDFCFTYNIVCTNTSHFFLLRSSIVIGACPVTTSDCIVAMIHNINGSVRLGAVHRTAPHRRIFALLKTAPRVSRRKNRHGH